MNKRTLTKGAAGFLMVSMVFAGCQVGPAAEETRVASDKSPAEVVKLMQATWAEENAKIGSVDGSMDLLVTSGETSLDLDTSIKGSYDVTDLAKPLFDMTFGFKGEAVDAGTTMGTGDLELQAKGLADAMYVNLAKFNLVSDDPQVAQVSAMVGGFVGTWYELPAEYVAAFQSNLQNEDTEAQDKVLAVAKDANLFKITDDKGVRNGQYHYAYEVDKDGFTQFLSDVKVAQGEPAPTEEELAEFKAGFDKVAITGEMWIGTADYRIDQLLINVKGSTAADEEAGTEASDIDMTLNVKYGEETSVTVTAPEGSQPFPF